ncbi:MAG: hypothetical protein PF693_15575 [Spirochaetia bacterium]|jgi:uncharacterized BrkB/YihY/UPF0761 family membrane protein|nr:hypothetical protein [Spirochaetia bacterium]
MDVRDIVMILSQISFGAIATFLAILYWSHTRDIAWLLIIMGVIIHYGQIMYSTFMMFGVLSDELFIIKDVLDIGTLLSIIPLIFISLAFIVMLVRFKRD